MKQSREAVKRRKYNKREKNKTRVLKEVKMVHFPLGLYFVQKLSVLFFFFLVRDTVEEVELYIQK